MTRPLVWMTAVRDHPKRPPAIQRCVLFSLALRMDWSTGTGYASTGTLMADADCQERTVRNATKWGRDNEMLNRTRRGHRLGDGSTVASEWQLQLPSETAFSTGTGMPVEAISTGTETDLNRHAGPSQPARSTPPSRTSSSRTSSSARGRADARGARAGADTEKQYRAPPCPGCGKPFTQEALADPSFRKRAMQGYMLCEDCYLGDVLLCIKCGREITDADLEAFEGLDDLADDDPARNLCPACRLKGNAP